MNPIYRSEKFAKYYDYLENKRGKEKGSETEGRTRVRVDFASLRPEQNMNDLFVDLQDGCYYYYYE